MPMMIHWMLSTLLLAAPAPAPAPACEDAAICRCVHFTQDEAAERADAVFLATVVRVREVDAADPSVPHRRREVRLRLHAAWKGLDASSAEVTVLAGNTSCDFQFAPGQQFLVYGRRAGERAFHAAMCSGTRLVAPGDADVAALGQPIASWTDAGEAPR
jgi:hypothetical protein